MDMKQLVMPALQVSGLCTVFVFGLKDATIRGPWWSILGHLILI